MHGLHIDELFLGDVRNILFKDSVSDASLATPRIATASVQIRGVP
jgi:hypothetical protein